MDEGEVVGRGQRGGVEAAPAGVCDGELARVELVVVPARVGVCMMRGAKWGRWQARGASLIISCSLLKVGCNGGRRLTAGNQW